MASYSFRLRDRASAPDDDMHSDFASDADAMRDAARMVADLLHEQATSDDRLSDITLVVLRDDGSTAGSIAIRTETSDVGADQETSR